MTLRTAPVCALGCLITVAALAGCGAPASVRDGAVRGAERFATSVAADQFAAACTDLAPGTRTELESDAKASCPNALRSAELSSGGTARQVDVYGQQARVVLANDTIFLIQSRGGWKVTAAGCQLQTTNSYDCAVKGG